MNATNEQGDTPLHNAARSGYSKHPVCSYIWDLLITMSGGLGMRLAGVEAWERGYLGWRTGNEASWGGGLGTRLAGVEAWERG